MAPGTLAVPGPARARALGALVPSGEHAVAFADEDRADSLLQGYVLEGLARDERVVVLTGQASPRAVAARLRAGGVAAPADRPDMLRIQPARGARRGLRPFVDAAGVEACRDGFEGLRVAVLCAAEPQRLVHAREAALPRRFRWPGRLLCVYTPRALAGAAPEEAWGLARHHARILAL